MSAKAVQSRSAKSDTAVAVESIPQSVLDEASAKLQSLSLPDTPTCNNLRSAIGVMMNYVSALQSDKKYVKEKERVNKMFVKALDSKTPDNISGPLAKVLYAIATGRTTDFINLYDMTSTKSPPSVDPKYDLANPNYNLHTKSSKDINAAFNYYERRSIVLCVMNSILKYEDLHYMISFCYKFDKMLTLNFMQSHLLPKKAYGFLKPEYLRIFAARTDQADESAELNREFTEDFPHYAKKLSKGLFKYYLDVTSKAKILKPKISQRTVKIKTPSKYALPSDTDYYGAVTPKGPTQHAIVEINKANYEGVFSNDVLLDIPSVFTNLSWKKRLEKLAKLVPNQQMVTLEKFSADELNGMICTRAKYPQVVQVVFTDAKGRHNMYPVECRRLKPKSELPKNRKQPIRVVEAKFGPSVGSVKIKQEAQNDDEEEYEEDESMDESKKRKRNSVETEDEEDEDEEYSTSHTNNHHNDSRKSISSDDEAKKHVAKKSKRHH